MPSSTRRAVLASLGSAAIAGCLDGDSGSTSSPATTGAESNTGTDPQSDIQSPATPQPADSTDTDWPMPGGDPGFSNATVAAGPTAAVEQRWQFAADAELSAPVVAHGAVYVGTATGDVVARGARSKRPRWRRTVGETAFTPRIVGDTLYIPTDSGIVACSADGTEQWRVTTPGRDDSTDDGALPPRVAVLATGESLYWIQTDEEGESPTVVAIALDGGEERWRTDIEAPWTRRLFASQDTVFVPSGTTGQQAWRLSTETGDVRSRPEAGYDFSAERLYRDGTVYATEPFFGSAYATSLDDGHSWNTDVPPGTHSVSAGPDRLYVGVSGGDNPGLYALSATDGSEVWDSPVVPTARPVVASDSLLVHGEEMLYCLDPADGSELWTRPNDDIGARMAVVDDLLFATRGKTLRAFSPR